MTEAPAVVWADGLLDVEGSCAGGVRLVRGLRNRTFSSLLGTVVPWLSRGGLGESESESSELSELGMDGPEEESK